MIKPILAIPLKLVTSLRRSYFNESKRVKLKAKVVSIGNLSFGGSGKTQLILSLVEEALAKNLSVGVVSGAYKIKIDKAKFVEVGSCEFFGDEPEMIKNRFPQVPVVVGPKKWKSAIFLEANMSSLDLIIIDDGFQHLKLARDVDIVLVDCSMNPNKFKIFPEGMLREPSEFLRFADQIILTKVNLAKNEYKEYYKKIINNLQLTSKTMEAKTVFSGAYDFNKKELNSSVLSSDSKRNNQKTMLVSAIGNPESFTRLINERYPKLNLSHRIYKDHYNFTNNDVTEIKNIFLKDGFDSIICTEKDYIKLSKFNWDKININYVRVSFDVFSLNGVSKREEFYGKVF